MSIIITVIIRPTGIVGVAAFSAVRSGPRHIHAALLVRRPATAAARCRLRGGPVVERPPRTRLPLESELPGPLLLGRRLPMDADRPASTDDPRRHLRFRAGHQARRPLQGLRRNPSRRRSRRSAGNAAVRRIGVGRGGGGGRRAGNDDLLPRLRRARPTHGRRRVERRRRPIRRRSVESDAARILPLLRRSVGRSVVVFFCFNCN